MVQPGFLRELLRSTLRFRQPFRAHRTESVEAARAPEAATTKAVSPSAASAHFGSGGGFGRKRYRTRVQQLPEFRRLRLERRWCQSRVVPKQRWILPPACFHLRTLRLPPGSDSDGAASSVASGCSSAPVMVSITASAASSICSLISPIFFEISSTTRLPSSALCARQMAPANRHRHDPVVSHALKNVHRFQKVQCVAQEFSG